MALRAVAPSQVCKSQPQAASFPGRFKLLMSQLIRMDATPTCCSQRRTCAGNLLEHPLFLSLCVTFFFLLPCPCRCVSSGFVRRRDEFSDAFALFFSPHHDGSLTHPDDTWGGKWIKTGTHMRKRRGSARILRERPQRRPGQDRAS